MFLKVFEAVFLAHHPINAYGRLFTFPILSNWLCISHMEGEKNKNGFSEKILRKIQVNNKDIGQFIYMFFGCVQIYIHVLYVLVSVN